MPHWLDVLSFDLCPFHVWAFKSLRPIELDFVRLVSVPITIGWDFIRLAAVPILTWWVRDSMGMSESVLLRTLIPCRRACGNEQTPMWRDVELRRPQVWQSLLSFFQVHAPLFFLSTPSTGIIFFYVKSTGACLREGIILFCWLFPLKLVDSCRS
jgi:hypothetical protein